MDHIQQIALLAREAAHDGEGKVLLYAEIEDYVISADLFSRGEGGPVRFRFSSSHLRRAILSFWESERAAARWATMAFTIENGQFAIDLQYEDSLKRGEGLEERRPRVVKAHFGDTPVDYSSPEFS